MSSTKMTAFSALSIAAHPKFEKKIIDEKIAKVREVVKNVSTNDIVLALHNFDLDVSRTINAFCEGGSENALGDWEKTGGAKKRNNKKKAKPPTQLNNNGHSASNLTKGTFGASSVSSISSATYSNGFSSNFNGNNSQHQQIPTNLLNGVQVAPMPMEGSNRASSTTAKPNANVSIPPTSTTTVADGNGTTFMMMNGGGGGENPLDKVPTCNNVMDMNLGSRDHPNSTGKEPDGSEDIFTPNPISIAPSDNQSHLEHNKSLFENEIVYAQGNIQRCFKEFRDAIAQREQQMLTELVECQRNGLAYFAARADVLQKLNAKAVSNPKAYTIELEKFNSAKTEDLETALTTRFLDDNAALSALVSTIGQFGSVIHVKIMAPPPLPVKKEVAKSSPSVTASPLGQQQVHRSNSPSSLVSSLDSGLGGQISPVNQEKAAVAQLDEGGIVLKSDCISADLLAEIQRNILESLKAKGIDPSVLAVINSSTITAPRRRQPPPSKTTTGGGEQQQKSSGAGQQQRPRANNATNNKAGPAKKQQPPPKQHGNKPPNNK